MDLKASLDHPQVIELQDDSLESIHEFFEAQGWSDGLPFVPPTEERVVQMLRFVPRPPDDLVATLAPRSGEATVRRIAINAVMAGCRPEYMPVLLAAVEAVADEAFNLNSIQSTTHPCGVFILVNGPIGREIGVHSGSGCFGPGWRANATIGRALRLVLWNVGGAIPGQGDLSAQGSPAKYTYCIAENEDANPWGPFHVGLGFDMTDSTVTVVAAEGPHNIQDHESLTGASILHTVAGSMREMGSNHMLLSGGDPMLIFGPEHARTVANDGYSIEDIKRYIWENAYLRLEDCAPDWSVPGTMTERLVDKTGQYAILRLSAHWSQIDVVVAGGPGKHSCWLPTFGSSTETITRRIDLPDGMPARTISDLDTATR